MAARQDRTRVKASGSITRLDWFLIAGIVLSPVTSVGLGPLNAGEWLVFIWCVLILIAFRKTTFIARFDLLWWLLFFCALFLGTIVGINLTPDQTSVEQIFTWFYFCLVFITIVTEFSTRSKSNIEGVLSRIGLWTIAVHVGLLAYSYIVSATIFGIELWYGDARFAGGGDNPHYLSLVVLVAIFIVFRLFCRQQNLGGKAVLLAFLGGGVWVAWATASTTLLTSALATVGCLLALYLVQARRIGLLWCMIASLVIFGLFQFSSLIQLARDVISSDPNGEGRVSLWLSFFSDFDLSRLLGLGPGTHGMGGTMEYHNLYLEFAAMSGVVGFILLFILLIYAVFGAAKIDILLSGPLLALAFYGFGGFSGRRLVFWVILALIIALYRKFDDQSDELCEQNACALTPDNVRPSYMRLRGRA